MFANNLVIKLHILFFVLRVYPGKYIFFLIDCKKFSRYACFHEEKTTLVVIKKKRVEIRERKINKQEM